MANKNNIIRSEQDGVEFFTNEETGESGMSQTGLARLCGVSPQAIKEILRTAATGQTRSRWLKDLQGQDCELQDCSYKNIKPIKAEVCAKIIKHYAFAGNAEAQYALDKFSESGVTTWIQGINGWKANRFHDKLHLAPFWYQRQVQFLADNKVPAGYFSIFGETISLVAELESAGYTLPDSSIPDISIGKCWANHLRKERINPDDISVMYPHKYPNYAYAVDAKAYLEDYLPKFRRWFRETYKTTKLPAYFKGKDSAALPAISRLLGLPAGVSI